MANKQIKKETIMRGMTPSQKVAYLKSEDIGKYAARLLDNKSGVSDAAGKDLVTINRLRKQAGLIKGEIKK